MLASRGSEALIWREGVALALGPPDGYPCSAASHR